MRMDAEAMLNEARNDNDPDALQTAIDQAIKVGVKARKIEAAQKTLEGIVGTSKTTSP